MGYQALYRVWRSQTFDGIVGQKAITQTLKNAIMQHKTSHAYLFTGPRGTGKTSAAKIFAKAINCHHSIDGEPCNECDICKSITEGRCNDVLEIDAASNNGVEEIRDIRDKVKYAPTEADYKVYIIDEVHMLSTGAFNALLKTLEEPPTNVIFILATTEPHKIPLTIISRTQRFDFKRIETKDIVEHMETILKSLEIPYEEEALFVIARAAEGGMRDALSILDQTISYSQDSVKVSDALQVTGSLTQETMELFLETCYHNETEKALELLESILDSGKEGRRFIEDLLLFCRDILMQQQAPQILEEKRGQASSHFVELAGMIPPQTLYGYIEVLSNTQQEIRFTNSPNIYLEVATVKLSSGAKKVNPKIESTDEASESAVVASLQQQVSLLQQQLGELKQHLSTMNRPGESVSPPNAATPRRNNQGEYRWPKEQVFQVLRKATRKDLQEVRNVWEDLLQILSVSHRAIVLSAEAVAASSTGLVIAFEYEIICQKAIEDATLLGQLQAGLARLIQHSLEIVCVPKKNWQELRTTFINTRSATESQDQAEELISVSEIPDETTAEEESLQQAYSLFGEENIIVMDD